ncbi:TPA: DUF551 domain-containing protein [Raoultella planticola]
MTKSTITREQLIKKAQEQIEFCRHTKITGEGRVHVNQCAALFEIALDAMDSEPVAEVLSNRPGNDTSTIDRALPVGTQLYRHAQPAPEKATVGEMPFLGTSEGAYVRGWNDCRAAMLQHQPQNAQQNIPENIPGGLVEAVNNLLNNDGSRGCYDAMECGTAREKIELWLAQRQRWEEQRKANLYAGNSPVIPDGWVACSERLPDETQPVITVSDGGVVQRTVYQFCEGVWSDWYEQYDDVTADAFTHWMPLPAAPQEVKGE